MTIAIDLDASRQFIARLDVREGKLGAKEPPDLGFDTARQQAVIVGSAVLSFDVGVESEFRTAVSDSALLAQLAATKSLGNNADPIAWFDAYFAVLGNIGWAIQARDTATYDIKADGVEVHEAIIEVITAFVGNVPGAAQLVTLALGSLQKMNEGSPLITIFEKNSQHATIGRFQFTTVRQDAAGGLLAEAMAFALNAERTIIQILFFKLSKSKQTLRRSLGTVSLNREALIKLQPAVRQKVQAHMADFVATLEI